MLWLHQDFKQVRSLINHFNKSFSTSTSDNDSQSNNEHIAKSKGQSSMKQHDKKETIKWVFKFWYRCASETEYLYQLYLYLS